MKLAQGNKRPRHLLSKACLGPESRTCAACAGAQHGYHSIGRRAGGAIAGEAGQRRFSHELCVGADLTVPTASFAVRVISRLSY